MERSKPITKESQHYGVKWPVTHLKITAGADLTQPGDAVKVISGHRLVLLLHESEGLEGEAGVVTVSVLMNGGHLVLGASVRQSGNKKC